MGVACMFADDSGRVDARRGVRRRGATDGWPVGLQLLGRSEVNRLGWGTMQTEQPKNASDFQVQRRFTFGEMETQGEGTCSRETKQRFALRVQVLGGDLNQMTSVPLNSIVRFTGSGCRFRDQFQGAELAGTPCAAKKAV